MNALKIQPTVWRRLEGFISDVSGRLAFLGLPVQGRFVLAPIIPDATMRALLRSSRNLKARPAHWLNH